MSNLRTTVVALMAIFASAQVSADGMDGYPTLWESYDHGLQVQLEGVLEDLGLNKAVRDKKLGVTLVDITDPEEPLVASVNGDTMLYAASLPKIAILLGAFVEIDHGNMVLDEDTRASLTRMIRKSSNADATRMLNHVGKNRLLEILQDDKFHLYDERVNGGLWIGKEYGKSAAYKRDPLHNLSHGATAMQAARLYYLMETGRVANPELTSEMKAMLGNPGINHKFVKGLASFPDAKIFRKSGSWSRWHADSAIVEADGHKYIIVGLAENKNGGKWLKSMIRPIHQFMVPKRLASNTNQ
ncbi:MAG: serine hydrolase [Gammaproteobacteria bacterium]